MDHDRLHLAGAPEASPEIHPLFFLPRLSPAVLAALQNIRTVRESEIRRLGLTDRRNLAAAEHVIALNIDLQAQIDGHGGGVD